MSLAEAALSASFIAWGLASVVSQFRTTRLARALRKRDLFHMLPVWTFFAPRPMTVDYVLVFRDVLDDGTVTPWTEIPLVLPRRWHDWFWHPGRRNQKILVDLVKMLTRHSNRLLRKKRGGRPKNRPVLLPPRIQLSLPYVVLLSYVTELRRTAPTTSVQFAVMVADAPDSAKALFVSAVHRLAPLAPRAA